MTKIIVMTRDGTQHEIEADVHMSVMENLRNNGIDDLLALCGGCCSCATCHVYVASPYDALLPEMTIDERELLEGSDQRKSGSRLSCQIMFEERLDGLKVTIAPAD